ncbi:CatB-related O-acetyltransferase [Neorhizobium sp. DAR64861/K0K2]|uniref:CatB-related O-acetyltransferase n=1 Tax=unclassified Neorhizobium TaxID=2629175 RepID=UPI0010E063F1|nr:MAG: CatB-related O-acetyltransferase [Pseudomonadota bacterium]
MSIKRVEFGARFTADELKSFGLDLEFSPKSQFQFGNSYEVPCQVKTSMRDVLSVGAFSYINGKGRFTNVRIGRYCSIAEGVEIGYPEHPTNWLSTSPVQYLRPNWATVVGDWKRMAHTTIKETVIQHDVWVGVGAFIRTGVTVGTGSIIGAHAVVTKDVPPYSIVAGNPGRLVRKRFEPELIDEMLETRWWEYSPAQLDGCPFDHPVAAIGFVRQLRMLDEPIYQPRRLLIAANGATLTEPQ